MFSKLLSVSVCVFMLSLSVIEFAYSHPDLPPGTPQAVKYNGYEDLRKIKLDAMTLRKPDLVVAQSVVKDLNDSWKDNEDAILKGLSVSISDALKGVFTTIGAISTGGKSIATQVAVTGPMFLDAAEEYSEAEKADRAILDRWVYVKAFSIALSGYDATIELQRKDWNEYTKHYFSVLEMEVDHDGGLYTGLNSSKFTVESLYKSINGLSVTINPDGSRDFETYRRGAPQKLTGYWHVISGYRQNYIGNTDHIMHPHSRWEQVKIADLPAKYPCYGGGECKVKFTNYYDAMYEHLVKCGTGENVNDAAKEIAQRMAHQIKAKLKPSHPDYDASLKTSHPKAYELLTPKLGGLWSPARVNEVIPLIANDLRKKRTHAEGCGLRYYKCNKALEDGHSKRKCLVVPADDDDGADAGDADGEGQASTSPSLSPSEDGVYTATAGGKHTVNLSVPQGWDLIYWYMRSPSESGLGSYQSYTSASDHKDEADSSGILKKASYTYAFPKNVSGDYVLTAYVYLSNNTISDPHPSYTVSVSLPGSTTTTTSTDTPSSTPSSTPSTPSQSSTPTASISPSSVYGFTSETLPNSDYGLVVSASEVISSVKWYINGSLYTTARAQYGSTSQTLWIRFSYTGTKAVRAVVTLRDSTDEVSASYTVTVSD